MRLQRISCASCGSSHFDHDEEGNLVCAFCGVKFASPREEILCPICGTENPADARRCKECAGTLGQRCTDCNHLNPPGVDHCEKCATPLDVFSAIAGRVESGGRQNPVAKQALVRTKAQDEHFMRENRARLEAEERARLARLAAQRQEAIKQQKIITYGAIIVIGGLGLLGLIIALLFM